MMCVFLRTSTEHMYYFFLESDERIVPICFTRLANDGEWAIRRGCPISYGLFYSTTITNLRCLLQGGRVSNFFSDVANRQIKHLTNLARNALLMKFSKRQSILSFSTTLAARNSFLTSFPLSFIFLMVLQECLRELFSF